MWVGMVVWVQTPCLGFEIIGPTSPVCRCQEEYSSQEETLISSVVNSPFVSISTDPLIN